MSDHQSVPAVFLDRVKQTPNRRAYRFPEGKGWGELTWKQTEGRVRAIAGGLLSFNVKPEERCAILASTSMNWILADFGILMAGGATTTVYPSNTPSECTYIITDSETVLVFCENDAQVEKLRTERANIPNVRKVINIAHEGDATDDGWVIGLAALEELGRKYNEENPAAIGERVASITKDQLATLIYTSGTTGQPKGVELLHDAWVFEGEAIDNMTTMTIDDVQFLWLPLSHSFGKVLLAAQLRIGFETAVDGNIPKLIDNLAIVRPTFMAAAPRIFEKVYNKVVTGAQQAGGLKLKIFQWAVVVGRQVSKLRQAGREPTGLLAIKYKIANKLVFSKLQARFGGRVRFFISGSAPLSREMAEFFHAAGILILEGYGLTESSAASFCNTMSTFRFGTVGPALTGVEVKIDPADGEILVRGRGIMRGYHNKPEATAETLKDGWLRTGDIGELDDGGRLKITDRKKDLIKTSGGKYVAPQHLEGSLKALCPYISQVLVHGNNRNFCTALVTIDAESMPVFKQEHGINGANYEEMTKHSAMLQTIQNAIDSLNQDQPSYSSIKKFAILPADFEIATGELTASLKVKRKVVETKYKDLLDGFYEGALSSI